MNCSEAAQQDTITDTSTTEIRPITIATNTSTPNQLTLIESKLTVRKSSGFFGLDTGSGVVDLSEHYRIKSYSINIPLSG